MSAVGEWFDEHVTELKSWAEKLLHKEDPEVKAVGAQIAAKAGEIEAEAKGDAETVAVADEAKTEAEHDAEQVAQSGAADAAAVVTSTVTTEPGTSNPGGTATLTGPAA